MMPFRPINGSTRTLQCTTYSTNVDIGQSATQANSLLITNSGNQPAHIRIGSSGQTATTNDMPVLPGSQVVINRAPTTDGDVNIAAICSATYATTLFVTTGYGE